MGSFLQAHAEAATWPPPAWDLHELTLVAFFYSPALDVARARWGVARGGVVTAGASPNPTVGGALGYNATTDRSEVTPWIRDVALDLPVEVAGKRGIRIAEARQRSEAARLGLITTAWEVRQRVRNAYLDFYLARQTDSLLARRLEIQERTVGILERWAAVGEASPTDVTRARVDLATTRVAAVEAAGLRTAARSELADALGVPPVALDGARLSFADLARVSLEVPP
ncbi:MAG TPA: TolC family protein, partial [Longimicrobiales bacterium]|nr:TolC family protein [Longimicrobiales bacterium]